MIKKSIKNHARISLTIAYSYDILSYKITMLSLTSSDKIEFTKKIKNQVNKTLKQYRQSLLQKLEITKVTVRRWEDDDEEAGLIDQFNVTHPLEKWEGCWVTQ